MITGIRPSVFYFVGCTKKVDLGHQYQYLYYCCDLFFDWLLS